MSSQTSGSETPVAKKVVNILTPNMAINEKDRSKITYRVPRSILKFNLVVVFLNKNSSLILSKN